MACEIRIEEEIIMECTLYLTDSCNLQCSYCYEGDQKKKKFLKAETLRNVLDFIVKTNVGERIYLTFLGGEPLLNKKMLYEAINIIDKEYPQEKQKFKYKTTTNGILLDEKTIDFFVENNFDLSISIDGDRDTHNLNRKSVSGKDVYDTIIYNLKKLIEKKIEFNTRLTVTTNNVHKLYDNVLFFYNMGVKRIYIGMDYSADWNEEKLQILDEQLSKTDEFYLNELSHTEDRVINIYDFKIGIFLAKRETRYCSAGSSNHLIINSEGELYPCSFVTNNPVWKVGTVENGLKYKEFRNTLKNYVCKVAKCKDCELGFTCQGARCGFLNYNMCGILNQPTDGICKLERIVYNHNLHVIKELYQSKNNRLMDMYHYAVEHDIELSMIFKKIIAV